MYANRNKQAPPFFMTVDNKTAIDFYIVVHSEYDVLPYPKYVIAI